MYCHDLWEVFASQNTDILVCATHSTIYLNSKGRLCTSSGHSTWNRFVSLHQLVTKNQMQSTRFICFPVAIWRDSLAWPLLVSNWYIIKNQDKYIWYLAFGFLANGWCNETNNRRGKYDITVAKWPDLQFSILALSQQRCRP